MFNNEIFQIIDLLASEYGWSIEEILQLDVFEALQLVKAIRERKKQDLKLLGLAVGLAFVGKLEKLDEIFEEKGEETTLGQLQDLYMKLGGDLKKFKEMLNKKEIII